MQEKQIRRNNIHRKIRSRMFGSKTRPRLCVFKSAKHMYAQLIDDEVGKVLVSVSDIKSKAKKGTKVNSATEIGKLIAKEAIEKKIESVVFDRGGFVFHGRIKAVANEREKED